MQVQTRPADFRIFLRLFKPLCSPCFRKRTRRRSRTSGPRGLQPRRTHVEVASLNYHRRSAPSHFVFSCSPFESDAFGDNSDQILIPIRNTSDQFVSLDRKNLPQNVEDVAGILKGELPPLRVWIDVAMACVHHLWVCAAIAPS